METHFEPFMGHLGINRQKKYMVPYGMFSQPYNQYLVRVRAYVRSHLSLMTEGNINVINFTASSECQAPVILETDKEH